MKNKKGYSFLEILISVFIFVVLMASFTFVFIRFFSSYKSTKAIQRNLENAQYAMNLIAKTLRTSSVIYCGIGTDKACASSPYLATRVFDYSQEKCIAYIFGDSTTLGQKGNLYYSEVTMPSGTSDPKAWCGSVGFPSWPIINSNYLDGSFFITPSDIDSSPPKAGKVTISMKVCSDSTCKDSAKIQTTVSLRDYVEFKETEL